MPVLDRILFIAGACIAALFFTSNRVAALGTPATNDAYANDSALRFNYAEALQKTLFFLEAQQNGQLSPNNRVGWRGPANLTDGQDVGRDLAGGLFDAGDHWTSNLTVGFVASTLAWSAVEKPAGWTSTGQMDELLETLIHVNDYFIKCVLNPTVANPAQNLDVVIGCGGREGIPSPQVHAIWAGGEMAGVIDPATGQPFTNRPTLRLNSTAPGGDIPALMASTMAASSIVIREHGHLLAAKPGYATFNPTAYADQLYSLAGKLTLFAHANMGSPSTDSITQAERDAIALRNNQALRSDGQIVEVGYRGAPIPMVFTALSWMARATSDAPTRQTWIDLAEAVYEGSYKAEYQNGNWKDFSAGNTSKMGAYNMMRLLPSLEKYHYELQDYCVNFLNYTPTPGGLRIRERSAHEYGSLRHANNAATIALYYSDYVEAAPVLSGNTWWKEGATNAQLKALFLRDAKRQVDYALGANPYGRSFLVGFGNQPFNHAHHRGAYGPFDGYDHLIDGKDFRRATNRHILYGALIAGPDNHDVFLCGTERQIYAPVPATTDYDIYYYFPNRATPVRKSTYVFDPADQPVQDVMDSKFNEVALDYNAGFMASLAWLNSNGYSNGAPLADSQFPPVETRDESLDYANTDRELLVTATLTEDSSSATQIDGRLWNRSRWPARVLSSPSIRYYFTHTGTVTPTLTNASGAVLSALQTDAIGNRYVEISWPGINLVPVTSATNVRNFTLRIAASGWNSTDDWSRQNATLNTIAVLPRIPVYQASSLVGGAAMPLDIVSTPTFNPTPGNYATAQSVTLTTTTTGASIRYTTDGSTPTSTTGSLYTSPINVASATTLKAIAYKASAPDSFLSSATYTIGALTDITDSLVGRWAMDEAGAILASDSSGQANHATMPALPATWTSPGRLGASSLTFDGTNKLQVNHSPSLNLTTSLTLSLWLNPANWGNSWESQLILQKGLYGWNSLWALSKPDSNALRFWIRSVNVNLDGPLPSVGQWLHIAATYDSTTAVSKLYYNGVRQATATGTPGTTIGASTDPLFLGGGEGPGSLKGTLDEVRLYNRVLSPSEIAIVAAWAPTLPPPTSAFAAFRTAYGLPSDGAQDTATPAGDGVPNLLKYAFNLLGSGTGQANTLATPNASVLSPSGSAGLPFASVGTGGDAGKLQLTFIRRKASGSPGISYVVEFSDALASWSTNPSATESVTSIDATFERVTVTDSVASQPKRFARVKVAAE